MSRAAIIGGGLIGGGWAARFLLNGWDVSVFDPSPETERKITQLLDNARRALPALYDRMLPAEGNLVFCETLAEAVSGADWVQESISERLDLKRKVYAEIAKSLSSDVFIASSTSGFMASDLSIPEADVVVVHPFNPVYLMPLAELSGVPDACAHAARVVRSIGMYPLTLRKEIDAFIGNRFQEAVWREALWMIKDGVATTSEIDEAIRMSFGLRWAQMGIFESYRIAGGEAGMAHFLAQFGPALKWPWTKLMDVPDLDEALIAAISTQSDEQSGHLSFVELERLRDDNLVGIIRSLRHGNTGAGRVVREHEVSLPEGGEHDDLPITCRRVVPVDWTDYNGHMNEARYIDAASWATDGMMRLIGAGPDYVAAGKSYFTVDTRIRYLAEVKAGEVFTVTTQVIGAAGKKMHLFHRLWRSDGGLAATIETLLLHTDLTTRRSSEPNPDVLRALMGYANAHAEREAEGVGCAVGQRC